MENKQESKYMFPTEIVDLPSKGLLYGPDNPLSSGKVEMRYMTAKHEDIITNANYIENNVVIDKLLEALVVSDCNLEDLLIGDKNALLVAARILGYGKDYSFSFINPKTRQEEEIVIDLTTIEDKELDTELFKDGKNEFSYELPHSKHKLTFKLLTQKDESIIDKDLEGIAKVYGEGNVPAASTRLKHMITSVNGKREKTTINEFVDEVMLARDARELRKYMSEITPDVNLTFDYDKDGYVEEGISIPIGINFFWPEA